MWTLVGTVLAASLLGSAHCAAMCGPLACLATGEGTEPRGRASLPIAWYNLGRLAAYAALGGLAGWAGAGLDRLGLLAGVSRGAAIVAGALMVLWGVGTALAGLGVAAPVATQPARMARWLGSAVRRVRNAPPGPRGLALGLLTALLPCGWLYAFVATAAATGQMATGVLVMAVFWTGTVPIMAAVGLAAQRGLGPIRRRLPVATAAILVILGLLTISGRMTHAPSLPTQGAAHAGH